MIGSINMDLVFRTPRIPVAGETILGESPFTVPGGKGANQAVAAAKLAGPDTDVYMIGRVGGDHFGPRLLDGLTQNRVRTEFVTLTEGAPSGCAVILVDRKGENYIVVGPGSNARLTPADIDQAAGIIEGAAALLLQLEIPLPTVRHAIRLARKLGIFTILDPAPVPPDGLPADLFRVDLLTPNQGESELLTGRKRTHHVSSKKVSDPKWIAGELISRGASNVVLKLGSKGALLFEDDGRIRRFKAHKVCVTDTTAAGDAFSGALAVGRAEGMELGEMVRFANAAGAACCQKFGAQPALPTRDQVERLLEV